MAVCEQLHCIYMYMAAYGGPIAILWNDPRDA